MKKYKRSYIRAFCITLPSLILMCGFIISLAKLYNSSTFDLLKGCLLIFLTLVILIPSIILFANHWKFASGKLLTINNGELNFLSDEIQTKFSEKSILKIEEFGWPRRLRLFSFIYWHIYTENKCFVISNIMVSKSTMDRYLWNKIEEFDVKWPIIKGCAQQQFGKIPAEE
jgi:hypothetical protein